MFSSTIFLDYILNLEAIAKLEPDLVLLPMKLKDNIDALTDLGISVLVVNPESHEELVEMLELIVKMIFVSFFIVSLLDAQAANESAIITDKVKVSIFLIYL